MPRITFRTTGSPDSEKYLFKQPLLIGALASSLVSTSYFLDILLQHSPMDVNSEIIRFHSSNVLGEKRVQGTPSCGIIGACLPQKLCTGTSIGKRYTPFQWRQFFEAVLHKSGSLC